MWRVTIRILKTVVALIITTWPHLQLPGCCSHSLSIFVSRGRALPLFASLDLTKFYSWFDLVYPIHFVWCWPSDIFPGIIYPSRALPPNLHSFSSHIRTTFSKSDVYCFNYILRTSWYLYFEIYLIFVLFE